MFGAFFSRPELTIITVTLVDVKLCFLSVLSLLFGIRCDSFSSQKSWLVFNNFSFLLAYELLKTIAIHFTDWYSAFRLSHIKKNISHWFHWHKKKRFSWNEKVQISLFIRNEWIIFVQRIKTFSILNSLSVQCDEFWILLPLYKSYIV